MSSHAMKDRIATAESGSRSATTLLMIVRMAALGMTRSRRSGLAVAGSAAILRPRGREKNWVCGVKRCCEIDQRFADAAACFADAKR